MRLLQIIKVSLLLVILTITITACNEDNTATLNGTMTLQTRPVVGGVADKFSREPFVSTDIFTTANITFEEMEEGIFIEFRDFFGEGAFGSRPEITVKSGEVVGGEPFIVTQNPNQISSGTLTTGTVINLVDKNGLFGADQHDINLHLMVEINGQFLEFNDLQLTGSGDTAALEAETLPQQWTDGNGVLQELRIQVIEKDVGPLFGFF